MKKTSAQREEQIRNLPTPYTFNMQDVPADNYTAILKSLFADPDFKKMVEKRNRLVRSAAHMRTDTSQMSNLVRTIQQHDRRLADTLYSVLVQANLRSDVTYDFLSFNTLLRYFVDYSQELADEKVERLFNDLNKLTFLADMLESVTLYVKQEMQDVFGDEIEFQQFDGVQHVLKQLKGFFGSVRNHKEDTSEAQLYIEYADSINAYLDKRLKTYSDKLTRINPLPRPYAQKDIEEAVSRFFGIDRKLAGLYVKRNGSGGHHVDVMRLAGDLTPLQSEKLDRLVDASHIKVASHDAIDNYFFRITDALMAQYEKSQKA